jgi:hypothetical protein
MSFKASEGAVACGAYFTCPCLTKLRLNFLIEKDFIIEHFEDI